MKIFLFVFVINCFYQYWSAFRRTAFIWSTKKKGIVHWDSHRKPRSIHTNLWWIWINFLSIPRDLTVSSKIFVSLRFGFYVKTAFCVFRLNIKMNFLLSFIIQIALKTIVLRRLLLIEFKNLRRFSRRYNNNPGVWVSKLYSYTGCSSFSFFFSKILSS